MIFWRPLIRFYVQLFFLFLPLNYPIDAYNGNFVHYGRKNFRRPERAFFIFNYQNRLRLRWGRQTGLGPADCELFVDPTVILNYFQWFRRKWRMQNFIRLDQNRFFFWFLILHYFLLFLNFLENWSYCLLFRFLDGFELPLPGSPWLSLLFHIFIFNFWYQFLLSFFIFTYLFT